MQRLARREGIRWRVETSHEGGASSLNGFLSRRSTSRSVDYYLDEFTFRFTRRSSRSRGLLFYRLLEQAALTSPAPYRFIVEANPDFNIVWLVELNGYLPLAHWTNSEWFFVKKLGGASLKIEDVKKICVSRLGSAANRGSGLHSGIYALLRSLRPGQNPGMS